MLTMYTGRHAKIVNDVDNIISTIFTISFSYLSPIGLMLEKDFSTLGNASDQTDVLISKLGRVVKSFSHSDKI